MDKRWERPVALCPLRNQPEGWGKQFPSAWGPGGAQVAVEERREGPEVETVRTLEILERKGGERSGGSWAGVRADDVCVCGSLCGLSTGITRAFS